MFNTTSSDISDVSTCKLYFNIISATKLLDSIFSSRFFIYDNVTFFAENIFL